MATSRHMATSRPLRFLLLVAVAALVIGACGGAEPSIDQPATTSSTAGPTSEEGSSDEGSSDENVAGEAGDHEHEHDDAHGAIPWDGPEIPRLDVTVTGDPQSGWDIAATISGFAFSSPSRTEHVPGEGHTHVFVDGQLVSMSYEPVVHVDNLEPGEHQAMVTLSRNDHTDYSIDDELVMAMVTFTVPGEVEAADAAITVMYMGGEVTGVEGRPAVSTGELIEITVHSDVADIVHVHGYDLFLDLDAGEMDAIRFIADIPGVFEVEFEDSGVLLFEFRVS